MFDDPAIVVGTVLVQADNKGQMQSISYNLRLFTESEQKLALIYRELTATVYALEVYEFLIIGSKHPIEFSRDHKPILSPFAGKANINARFLRYKIVFTHFPKIIIFWTQGQKIGLANLLSGFFLFKFSKYQQQLRKNHSTNN